MCSIRVPGISLFWGPGSLAVSCELAFGGSSDVGYGSDCLSMVPIGFRTRAGSWDWTTAGSRES
eukprot:744616-Pyramimonas_sp.AAC.1